MAKSLITLAFLFTALLSYGQSTEFLFGKQKSEYKTNPATGIIRCATDEYTYFLQQNSRKESKEQFESWLAPKVEEIKKLQEMNVSKKVVVTIPVVVHIIHSGQPISNNTRNITNERVLSQITVLNQDFRRMLGTPGYNNNPVGADIEVEFCLAKVNPTGGATNGIDRVNIASPTTWGESDVENVLKPQTIWDPTRYFNIWVCQFGGDLGGVLGYAQFPESSGLGGLPPSFNNTTDGVIIDWRAFGSSDYVGGSYFQGIDKGRTTTHEIGHAFGLRHIWGDNASCSVNATDSFKDYCPDTPAQNTEHYDCFSIYDTCPSNPGNDMTENYMDYSNDSCMNIFTQNQKSRILAVLQNSPRRSTLTTSTVCNDPLSVNESGTLKNEINIYPNPVKDYLNIYAQKGTKLTRYSIYNALGQEVLKKEIQSESDLRISKEKLGTGFFIITIYTETGFKNFKFIVE
ncbi:M43 family zinc metalloprotease [Chryseobacterium echinoideorum]|uniref:M43 family zinc metalloprotease n=1 Tax=Chryseobacterium echinoideorum TaxID=1549648 RepID=UPI001186EF5A|nr:M43 family zinc metalloprotease [Chryseobacterium echinoideorum]